MRRQVHDPEVLRKLIASNIVPPPMDPNFKMPVPTAAEFEDLNAPSPDAELIATGQFDYPGGTIPDDDDESEGDGEEDSHA
jgi:hypothetical protein